MPEYITTKQAAHALGLTVQRVRQLINQDRLRATRLGRDWLIERADLATVNRGKEGWPLGRPRKERASMFTTIVDVYQFYSDLHGSSEPVWNRDDLHSWLQEHTDKPLRDLTEDDVRDAYDASLAEATE